MAEKEDSTGGKSELVQGEDETTLANRRLNVALTALHEINTLSKVLRAHAEDELSYLIARGITMRMQELSDVAVSVLQDSVETTDELQYRVTLNEPLQIA